jgi:hypothetical protein
MGAMRTRGSLIILLAGLIMILCGGCSRENDLTGPGAVNSPPDTRLTASRPDPYGTGTVVHFEWSGSDPEGELRGFEWRLCVQTDDGIRIVEDVVADPAASASPDGWRFTEATGTTIDLESDKGGGDAGGLAGDKHIPEVFIFSVRSIDRDGAVDLSPAELRLTTPHPLPRVYVDRPARLQGIQEAQRMPPTVNLGFTAIEMDAPGGSPTHFRTIWKRAWIEDPPHYVRTKYEYDWRVDELLPFDDPMWADWLPYPANPADRVVSYPNQPMRDDEGRQICYLFAVQIRDATGAVTVERTYSRNVQNLFITTNMTPLLTVDEPTLGTELFTGTIGVLFFDISPVQPLEFSWIGSAERYFDSIAAYRYGWDVVDPDDQNDPGWALPPGDTPAHRQAPTQTFAFGSHTLTIHCWDEQDQLTRAVYVLNVVE